MGGAEELGTVIGSVVAVLLGRDAIAWTVQRRRNGNGNGLRGHAQNYELVTPLMKLAESVARLEAESAQARAEAKEDRGEQLQRLTEISTLLKLLVGESRGR